MYYCCLCDVSSTAKKKRYKDYWFAINQIGRERESRRESPPAKKVIKSSLLFMSKSIVQ